MPTISKRLRTFRLISGLSMREAAKRIGVPETTYREWEYGRAIRGEPYIRIARTFGVSLDTLFANNISSRQPTEHDFDRIISEIQALKTKVIKSD